MTDNVEISEDIIRPANLKESAWIPSKRISALNRSQCGSINGVTDRRRTDGSRDVVLDDVLYEKPIPSGE